MNALAVADKINSSIEKNNFPGVISIINISAFE